MIYIHRPQPKRDVPKKRARAAFDRFKRVNLDSVEASLVAIRKTTNEDETLANINEALTALRGRPA